MAGDAPEQAATTKKGAATPSPPKRRLTVEIDASAERWRIEIEGKAHEVPPPNLGDPERPSPPGATSRHLRDIVEDTPLGTPAPPTFAGALLALRSMAIQELATDRSGRPLNPADNVVERGMAAVAHSVGTALVAFLPPDAPSALAALAALGAESGEALLIVRVRGPQANAALTLPWELLPVGDRFPVADGRLSVAREAVAEGAAGGLPSPPLPFSMVAHVAAPQNAGVFELNLEEAAFRMARALHGFEDRTCFTNLGTLEDLERAAQRVKPVLVHFAGHGLPGRLLFENADGGPDEVETNRLLLSLSEAIGRLPAAIWLSCCYGAGIGGGERPSSTARAWDLLGPQTSSIAADLHRAGVPQVLGYFGPVPDALAVEVDRGLFEELARSGSTLKAVRSARLRSQKAIDTNRGWLRFPFAWTLLGLYHRGDDVPLLDAKSASDSGLAIEDELERLAENSDETIDDKLDGIQALKHGFIGRRRLLAKMRRHREESRYNVLGLYGLGGLGKTATMMYLARVFAGDGKGWQERVVALSLQKRDKSFAALREVVVAAMGKYRARPENWDARLKTIEDGSNDRGAALARVLLGALADCVLYLDNAEMMQLDPGTGVRDHVQVPWCDAEVASFFQTLCLKPPAHVTVLLTTRYRPQGTGGVWVPIEPCTKDEIFRMTWWFPRLRLLPPSLRAELADRHLAGHPRAVEWIDTLIEEESSRWRDEGGDLREDADPDEVRARVLEPALARLPEKATPDLVLRAIIEQLGPGPRALLGECCAIGLPVPLEVVRRLGEGGEALRARGLLTCFNEQKSGEKGEKKSEGAMVWEERWAVHPFVREALERSGAGTWTKAGRGVLADYWLSQGKAEGGAPEPVWREALEHLLAAECWDDAIPVVVTLDDAYQHRGWVRASVELFEDVSKHAWPEAQRGGVRYRTSQALLAAGQYGLAEQAAREAIAIQEKVYGTREHADVAAPLSGLANVLMSQGFYSQAEDICREAIAIEEKVYGTREHSRIASSLHGLATVLWSQARYLEAEVVYRESIAIREKVYGTREHSRIASSLHGLATVLWRQGRYLEAEGVYREIIIKAKAYGTYERAGVAASLSGLATVLDDQGRYPEAEGVYREAIAIQEKVYGTREHADVAASLSGLANVLNNQGRYPEAEGVWCEAIAIQEKAYGTRERPQVASSLHGLANVLWSQARYPEAESVYREAIAIQEKAYGTRAHVDLVSSLHGLATVLWNQGRYPEAEGVYREVIPIKMKVYGTREHADVAVSLHGLANVLWSQGRYPEAEGVYREATTILEKAYGTREHSRVASSLHGLANVLGSQGDYQEAEIAYLESISIKEKAYGTRNHAEIAASLHGLATVHLALDRSAEAEQCLNEAVAISSAVFKSRRTPATIPTLTILARLLLAQWRTDEAFSYASDAWQGALEAGHLVLAVETGPRLVLVLLALGRQDEARDVVGAVVACLQQLPEDHPVRDEVERDMGLRE